MARASVRRPLPAAAFLVALIVLTSVVWIRVLHRGNGSSASAASPACTRSTSTVVPQPGAVTVHVLNTTSRNGLAAGVQRTLVVLGFKVPDVGDDTPAYTGVAEIRYGPSGRPGATLLAFYFPGSSLKLGTDTGTDVTVALGAKYTALASTAGVKRALKNAGITQLAPAGGKLVATPSPAPTPSC